MRFLLLIIGSLTIGLSSWAQPLVEPMPYLADQAARWRQIQDFRALNKGYIQRTLRTTAVLDLPFLEDFSGSRITPDSLLWVRNSGVYVGDRFSYRAPSKGVATFDGVQVNGQPYNSNPLANGPCDSLTSQAIRVPAGTQTRLSFFLQAGHPITALRPDTTDSLRVDFYNAGSRAWRTVRVFRGGQTDFSFRFYSIAVADSFAGEAFRFRFINFGRQNGAFDIWNLDYMLLDVGRAETDTAINDVALARPMGGFFAQGYRAIPADHFNAAGPAAFSDSLAYQIQNLNPGIVVYTARLRADSLQPDQPSPIGQNLLDAPVPVLPLNERGRPDARLRQVVPRATLQGLAGGRPFRGVGQFRYSFVAAISDRNFNTIATNDTLTDTASLGNYYAADDGSPEIVASVAGNLAGMAVRFVPLAPGSITGAEIAFDPSSFSINPVLTARIFIYRRLRGIDSTADAIAFVETVTLVPNGNRRYRFRFSRAVPVDQRGFYLAYRQDINDDNRLFVQADINSGQADIYTNIFGAWTKDAIIPGRPIFRPIFACVLCPVATRPRLERSLLALAPNPVQSGQRLRLQGSFHQAWLSTADGRRLPLTVAEGPATTEATLPAGLPAGLYVVEALGRTGPPAQARLVVE